MAVTHETIGEILEAAGDRAEALASYGAALAIRERSPEIFAGQAEQENTVRIRRKVTELQG